MSQNKLIIFVKNEEAGKVKTRLAARIGDKQALEVYRMLLEYTWSQTSELKEKKEVWYSSYAGINDVWDRGDFGKKIQSGENLGERMSEAFQTSLVKEADKHTVLIGSDCAGLTTEILEEAFQQLQKKDLVLGPAADGGYYLIGMNTYFPQLFEGIVWSTDSVLKKTLGTAEQLGIEWHLLPELNDVDTIEDWNLVKERLTLAHDKHHNTGS